MKKRRVLSVIFLVFLLLVVYGLYDNIHPRIDAKPNHPDKDWDHGPLIHLIPTASHNRIIIKASFYKPFSEPPRIAIGDRTVDGVMTDTKGYFWLFDIQNLEPNTTYTLVIQDATGKDLTDPWTIKTLPHPNSTPKHLRILIFTGSGGHDVYQTWLFKQHLPIDVRQRLLNRALSFKPDIVISSGDQIYYDLVYGISAKGQGQLMRSISYARKFDFNKPVLGTENEEVLKKAVGPQVAYLFGTALKSTPAYFLLDDHDYFENDEAIKEDKFCKICLLLQILTLNAPNPYIKAGISFPPDRFHLELARAAQYLFLPELIPMVEPPASLPSYDSPDRPKKTSECTYGVIRWGKLFEGLLYESRRYVTLNGSEAYMIHPVAEEWIEDRMKKEEAIWVVNIPATVFGWSAGKWMEWYPDVCCEDGKLTTKEEKYMWQSGWFEQHNRILKAASSMKQTPVFLCGDLHAQAYGIISRTGELDLSKNPVHVVVTGPLGTDEWGFPSKFRNVPPQIPEAVEMVEKLKPVEKDGFALVDITPEKMTIRLFAWSSKEPVEKIDSLQPYYTIEIPSNKHLSN